MPGLWPQLPVAAGPTPFHSDAHIQPERSAFDGVRTCLEHCQSHKDKPDILVTGGDMIMDAYDQGFDRTKAQWELWTRVQSSH